MGLPTAFLKTGFPKLGVPQMWHRFLGPPSIHHPMGPQRPGELRKAWRSCACVTRILNCLIHLSSLFPYSPSLWTSGSPPSSFPPGCCLGTALPLDNPPPRNSELKEKGSKKSNKEAHSFSILPNRTSFPLFSRWHGMQPRSGRKAVSRAGVRLRNNTVLPATFSSLPWRLILPFPSTNRILEADATPPLSHCFYLLFSYQPPS